MELRTLFSAARSFGPPPAANRTTMSRAARMMASSRPRLGCETTRGRVKSETCWKIGRTGAWLPLSETTRPAVPTFSGEHPVGKRVPAWERVAAPQAHPDIDICTPCGMRYPGRVTST